MTLWHSFRNIWISKRATINQNEHLQLLYLSGLRFYSFTRSSISSNDSRFLLNELNIIRRRILWINLWKSIVFDFWILVKRLFVLINWTKFHVVLFLIWWKQNIKFRKATNLSCHQKHCVLFLKQVAPLDVYW